MNYFYSNKGLRGVSGTDGIIAFSSREHESLYRDSLNKTRGLEPDPFAHFRVDYRCPNGSKRSVDSWGSVDWDCDGNIADGSLNGNIQNAKEVALYGANPQTALGSEDYEHLYFWGVGPSWDARNIAIIERDQPGTDEPTIEQAKAEGVWWPNLSVQTDGHIELTAYSGTGVVDIPLTLTNPGSVDFTVEPKLTAADPEFSLDSSVMSLDAGGSTKLSLRLDDTTGITGPRDRRATIEYSHTASDILGSIELLVHVPSTDELGPNSCSTARQARKAQDLPSYQIPALDAFLSNCADTQPPTQCAGKTGTPARIGIYNGKRAIFGTKGDDVIIGTADAEIIRADDGNDIICAGDGPDVVYGGSGADVIASAGGNDTVYGQNGADRIRAGEGGTTGCFLAVPVPTDRGRGRRRPRAWRRRRRRSERGNRQRRHQRWSR